jgi:DegV family protein with EDD domain
MGNVKIVTDSTCDLPISLVEELDFLVIPCYVNMNGKSYLDGIDLTREFFFKSLPTANPLPTTSAPGMDAFIQMYQKLANDGADGIISIHISETLSNINNVAKKIKYLYLDACTLSHLSTTTHSLFPMSVSSERVCLEGLSGQLAYTVSSP